MKLKTLKRITAMRLLNRLSGTKFFSLKRKLLMAAGHEVGQDVKIVGPVFCSGTLHIGNGCWLGRCLSVEGNGHVYIGDNCDVAPEVTFLTGGHKIGSARHRAGEGETYTIYIERGTWIGARSTILRSVTVGESCVVSACACVAADIPANSLVGGIPAKVIRTLDP